MNKKHVIVGIIVIAILLIGLFLLLSNNKTNGNMAVPTQVPEPEIVTEAPTDNPTERITIRITNPPTEEPTSLPPTTTPNPWKETEYPPTCEEAGYVVRENTVEGYSVIEEGLPALGHAYGEWKEDPETGMMVTTCIRCGKEIRQKTAYEGIIPRIDFTGSMEGISKSDRVTLRFDYTSPTESFSCYSYTSWQGHNTLNYPKKNYTIRLFDDEEVSQKHQLNLNGWGREHKFVLKANYRDVSQARNLIAADLWADMAKTRSNLYERLKRTSNYGAVAGFPVIVYLNGDFIGLYTMCLHIDDDLYLMKNEYDAVMIANSTEPNETRFLSLASFDDEKNAWEVEYCGTGDNNQWAKDKLNELIRLVMTSDDETFREHLKDYLDVDGAIDYLLFLYLTGLERNASKDLVLLKYEDCDAWIPTVYDMERAFGLNYEGNAWLQADEFLPTLNYGIWNSNTQSRLWERLLQLFIPEIKTRYSELRTMVLTESQIFEKIDAYFQQIPEEYYEMDDSLYWREMKNDHQQEQIKNYVHEKLVLLDALFAEE